MNKQARYFTALFLLLLFLQIVLFNRLDVFIMPAYSPYVLVYPLFFFLLPVDVNRPLLLLLAFIMGFLVDLSLGSPGVHAGASVFSAYARRFVLFLNEPRSGFEKNVVPGLGVFDLLWVLRYYGVMLFIHSLALFMLEIFTLYFLFTIILKSILTTLVSLLGILIIQLLYKPTT